MAVNGTIVGTVTMATVTNIYGAVKKGRSVDIPIIGGFVVALFLLAIAETKANRMAVAFAVAFFITSLSLNGTDLLNLITSVSTTTPAPAKPTNGGTGGPETERAI